MANVGAVINNIRNTMRQDRGISGDAQRLEQLGWMLFLKIIDDKDKELEITNDDYVSVIPEKFQWRNWAEDSEGITGDELLAFIDNYSEDNKGLFATLRNLTAINKSKRAALIQEVFEGNNNYMKSGYEMRKVINKLNEIDFNSSEDKHIFGTIYESILQELRDAGNKGEYYTPRAVTQFMTLMTDPKLGEKILDPAAGTGGFLTAAIDHIKGNYVRTPDDFNVLQNSVIGWEFKPVAYVLGLTNLILHDIDVPDYEYTDSLKREYNSITNKDRVDVILANPPFGASIAEGVETNFPMSLRCRESADLFVVLMIQMLKKNGGRAAIVLPDGSITGDGVKARIREKLLTECNLHTIVRMPQSTFFPATVSTNLLFFDKGEPTKEIWYYEHRLPEGQKSYSKTKPIRFEEFEPLMAWWNNRTESEVAWRVDVKDLKNWDLDIKNPTKVEEAETFSSAELIEKLEQSFCRCSELLNDLKRWFIMSWQQVKIGSFLKRIKRPVKVDVNSEYKLVTIRINHNGVSLRETKRGSDLKSNMYEVKEGDFILSGIDARNGAFGIIPKELDGALVTNDFWYFDIDESVIDKHFFLELTSTNWFDEICKRGSDGTTQRIRLQKDKFFNQIITLPKTMAFQKELLLKTNKVKTKQIELSNEISLQKDYLAKLKQSILQDAISGNLTEDWRAKNGDVEPASELLKRIKAEKQQMIKEGKIRKEKPLEPITESELPFPIPPTWQWCRLGDILNSTDGGKSPNCQNTAVVGMSLGVIKTTAIQDYGFVQEENKILPPNFSFSEKHQVKVNDVLITRAGPLNRTGVVCCVNEITQNLILSDKTIRLNFNNNCIIANYIPFVLNNQVIKNGIIGKMTGMAQSQVNISQDNMKLYYFPLPPFEEQQRIVEIIKESLEKCSLIEEKIKANEQNAADLLKAVLAEAFQG